MVTIKIIEQNITNVGECMKKLEPLWMLQLLCKTVWQSPPPPSPKLKIELPYDPAIVLAYIQKNRKQGFIEIYVYIVALLTISKG